MTFNIINCTSGFKKEYIYIYKYMNHVGFNYFLSLLELSGLFKRKITQQ